MLISSIDCQPIVFKIYFLEQHGGDVNAADHTGQTALHWSAVRGAIQVTELLLREGARVNAADIYGYQVRLDMLQQSTVFEAKFYLQRRNMIMDQWLYYV